MAKEGEPSSSAGTSTIIPSDFNTGDMPTMEKIFLYFAIQESKGNGITMGDWEIMSLFSNGKYTAGSLKTAFMKVRKRAREYGQSKGVKFVGNGKASEKKTENTKPKPKKRAASESADAEEQPKAAAKPRKKAKAKEPKVKEEASDEEGAAKPRKKAKGKEPNVKEEASDEEGTAGVNGD